MRPNLHNLKISSSFLKFSKKCCFFENMLVYSFLLLLTTFKPIFSQTLIYTEPFDNTTNLTPNTGAFSFCATSGTCGNNDVFNTTNNATILGCLGGEVGSVFAVIDYDACNVNNSSFIVNMTVPAGNNGLIQFRGNFAALGGGIDAGDNFVVAADINDGNGFVNKITFTQNSGTTYTDGAVLNSNFSQRQFNLGSGLAGVTIKIKITFNLGGQSDEGAAFDEFQLYHTPPACTAPTVQASNVTISNVLANTMDVSWTNGDGNAVLVVARATSSTLTNPTIGTSYTANTAFGSGTQIGSGNYVVYNGTGTSVSLTGLSAGVNYTISVYSFNTTLTCNPPTTQASGVSFASVTQNSMTVSWTRGNGTNILVVARASTLTDPSIGTSYTANAAFGSGTQIGTGNFVVYSGTGTSVAVSGLSPNVNYTFSVYEFNTTGNCYMLAENNGNQTTLNCSAPTTQATSLSFSAVTANSMTVSWTRGDGTNVLVVARLTSSTLTDPTNGTSYTANSLFTGGTQIGTGNYVVYSGTGTSVNVTGLTTLTNYSFAVYEFNSASNCYLLTELSGSQSTIFGGTYYYVNNTYDPTQDIFCTAAGASGNTGLSPSSPKATLTQIWTTYGPAGSNVLTAGDVILIDAGTYTTDKKLNINVAGLTFRGAGSDKTYFDNNYAAATTQYFMYISASDVTVEEMTIQEYDNQGTQTPGHSGQAITVGGTASPITGVLIKNVVFFKNGSSGGNPSLSVLRNTTAVVEGGGSYCNKWATQYTGGIEAYGNNIDLTIRNYIIGYNFKEGTFDGGGLRIEGSNTTVVKLNNVLISSNIAVNGGGIAMYGGQLIANDCVIEKNIFSQTSTVVRGGGVYISCGTASFTRCIFRGNTSPETSSDGGGIACRYSSAGAFSATNTINLTIHECTFSGNIPKRNGTDIYAANGFGNACNITVTDTRFQSGATNIVSDATSPASSINVTYIGANPPSTGANITKAASASTYTANPTVPTFGGDCDNLILPVVLHVWSAHRMESDVHLHWSTLSELNNDFFSIELSLDGTYFQSVGSVKGNGTSYQEIHYQFIDQNIPAQKLYYRLVQKDFNDESRVSSVIELDMQQNNEILVYPNPLQDKLLIDFVSESNKRTDIKITDQFGRIIIQQEYFSKEAGKQKIQMSMQDLTQGVYFIQIKNSNQSFVKQLIKLD